jgi:hypothetical protein
VSQIRQLGFEKFLGVKMKLYPIRVDYDTFCGQFLKLNGNYNTPFSDLEADNSNNNKSSSMALERTSVSKRQDKADFRQLSQ